MPVSLDGVSGLNPQFQSAFSRAVEAESRPLEMLGQKKGDIENRVTLLDDIIGRVNEVSGTLPDLATPRSLRELEVSSTQDNAVNGTADKDIAEPGAYNIEVLQLATNASALSNGFPDKNSTTVGSGYFTFSTADGDSVDVYVDNDNGTLEGIARTINAAKVGMKASVVRDASDPENPFRLAMSAAGTGAENTVEYPVFYFIDGESDFYVEKEKDATNAKVRYEGLEIETDSNKIENLIPGVTVNISGVTNGPAQLKIDHDVPRIKEKVVDWVEKVNSVLSFIQEQNTIDENTQTNRTLGNDYGIRLTEGRFRTALQQNTIFSDIQTSIRSLSDMGIEFQRSGLLDLNEKKLEDAINSNFSDVADLLGGNGRTSGIITGLKSAVEIAATPRGGVLTTQKKNYIDRAKQIQKNITRVEARVEKKADFLKERLLKAQQSLNQLQGQSSQLASIGSGGGLLNQLVGS